MGIVWMKKYLGKLGRISSDFYLILIDVFVRARLQQPL
jgi:hypothetical protein